MGPRPRRVVIVIGLCALAAGGGGAPEGAPAGITAARIRAHMRFLADDRLEGREPGTRGFELAAAYVAAQLEGMGLAPLESGGYFQEVPLRRATPSESILEIRGTEGRVALDAGHDFVVAGDPARESYEAEAEVVLVGHGIRAPEIGHDDYEGLDVEGRIVAFVSGAPELLPEAAQGYFGGPTEKWRAAARLGAVGAFSLPTEPAPSRPSWDDTVTSARKWLPLLGSDHFPFARAGVPALWAIAGQETGRDGLDGAALQREWIETRLHTPRDDMSQPLDFQAAADLAAFDFRVGQEVANAETPPTWSEETLIRVLMGGER